MPHSASLTLAPDADGLIASMTDEANALTTMKYQAGGELGEANFPDHTQAKYEYQASGLRARLVYKDGRRVEYSYDPAGNLTATKVFDNRGKQVNGQTLEMNDAYQLVRWVLFDGTETTFQYDANGNLTEIKKGKSITRFEYDALDRLTAVITPDGQRLTYSYKPGERSLIEQYEHAAVLVADLRDTGLTFTGPFSAMASHPLASAFGSVRFSETLGTFQMANADGSEIVRPQEGIEGALAKLHLYSPDLTRKALQSGFSAPFNTMFTPPEYLTINCCPECYYDGSEWYCPPCNPSPIPSGSLLANVGPGPKSAGDNLQYGTGTQTCSESLGLQDCSLSRGTWVWNVEIEGDVTDDVSNWTISQQVTQSASGFAKDSSGQLQAWSEPSGTVPDTPPSEFTQQPAGQTTMFWIDAPGHAVLANVNGTLMPIDSMTQVKNFTSTICNTGGGICVSYNWFVKIVVKSPGTLDTTNSKAGSGTAP